MEGIKSARKSLNGTDAYKVYIYKSLASTSLAFLVDCPKVSAWNEGKEKLTKIVTTFVCASSQGQRTHYDQTNTVRLDP